MVSDVARPDLFSVCKNHCRPVRSEASADRGLNKSETRRTDVPAPHGAGAADNEAWRKNRQEVSVQSCIQEENSSNPQLITSYHMQECVCV